jgi:hypothetical protein
MLRVSRLYPLHVSMLLVCAAIQWTLLVLHKPLVVYDAADLYHFVLQLLYLNSVFGKSWAFNEPSGPSAPRSSPISCSSSARRAGRVATFRPRWAWSSWG